jgi:pyridoxal phosphate enzyme (YggS family)
MATIADNLQAVRERIERAARAARRDPLSVTLLAVSKTHPAARIEEARAAGQAAFGENYVQEALEKMASLEEMRSPALEWHLIGPLQSNKTRAAAERFDWVHTVSSEKIARRLSEQRPAGLAPLNVLIQVNVSGEATKAGISPEAALPLAAAIRLLKGIRLRGLMAVPEATGDSALQRRRFSEVKKVLEALNKEGLALDTLSMGMSDDMESAIAEGATMVRIGTAIFGARAKIKSAA